MSFRWATIKSVTIKSTLFSAKLLFPVFFMVLFFTEISCRKKYEDDPWTMRFVNLEKRIEGEWNIQKILIDGIDSTAMIYIDSLQIFSVYVFSNFSRSYGYGKLVVKTYDKIWIYDGLRFIFSKVTDLNTVGFYYGSGPGPASNLQKNIEQFGAINNYLDGIEWKIHKLTKEEMQISCFYHLKNYELYFIKN